MVLMSFWLVLALFLDQFSKKFIVELVSPGETFEVLGNFLMITNIGNTGISFGMFQGYTHILIPLVFVIIGMVFIVSLKFVKQSPWLAFAFGSIIGGALGNQIDRIFKGAVVDFIYVNGFAVFNVSDSFVVVGAFILGFHTIFVAENKDESTIEKRYDLRDRIANKVKMGAFDYYGQNKKAVKDFIGWLFDEGRNSFLLLWKNSERELPITFLQKGLQIRPFIVVQDLIQ